MPYADRGGDLIMKNHAQSEIQITTVFDNYAFQAPLKTAWGYACVVTGLDKTVLFDTGGDGAVLLANMKALNIDPSSIDYVFLSHIDGDHTDGLAHFLAVNPNVTVHLLDSFPSDFMAETRRLGAKVHPVDGPEQIFETAFTTGVIGQLRSEHSLIVDLGEIAAIITGCAHPGIATIVARAREIVDAKPFLITGGFHLFRSNKSEINDVIADLKGLGVKWAGPCHCTGDLGIHLFKEAFGENFIKVGVGKTINLSTLK